MKYAGLALIVFGVLNCLVAVAVALLAVWGAWPADSGLEPENIGFIHACIGMFALLGGGALWAESS